MRQERGSRSALEGERILLIRVPTADELRRCQLVVCGQARDVAEARQFFDMLGLLNVPAVG